jgi:hypothetical protein
MQRQRQRGNQRWIENQADKKTTGIEAIYLILFNLEISDSDYVKNTLKKKRKRKES